MATSNNLDTHWRRIYQLGGGAALGAVLISALEILITFLPGGNTTQETALDWLRLFQQNWFLGLRNLGLLNIFFISLGILTYFALYAAHRDTPYRPYAALVASVSFIGIGVFLATNRAFPMLALSQQYTAATTDAQRAMLETAAQAMLVVGASHTPGTFLGFFLSESAGILISCVMLRSGIFSKVAALAGLLGFTMLLIFEITSSFVVGLSAVAMGLAMLGGISSMIWYILVARTLFRLARQPVVSTQD